MVRLILNTPQNTCSYSQVGSYLRVQLIFSRVAVRVKHENDVNPAVRRKMNVCVAIAYATDSQFAMRQSNINYT